MSERDREGKRDRYIKREIEIEKKRLRETNSNRDREGKRNRKRAVFS